MQQNYFILVLAHSLRGKLRRIRVPLKVVYAVMALALLGCISIFGFISSYARMAWKVANYNALRRKWMPCASAINGCRRWSNQTNQQMASLEMFANEVSIAYGIKQKLEGPAGIAAEGRLLPTVLRFRGGLPCAAQLPWRREQLRAPLAHQCAAQHLAGGGPPDGRLRRAHGSVLR
jgi:hypothetical protein